MHETVKSSLCLSPKFYTSYVVLDPSLKKDVSLKSELRFKLLSGRGLAKCAKWVWSRCGLWCT